MSEYKTTIDLKVSPRGTIITKYTDGIMLVADTGKKLQDLLDKVIKLKGRKD